MKKRLFLGAFVLLLATTAFFTNTQNSKTTDISLSDLIAANTANAEAGDKILCSATADCDLVGGDGNVSCNGYDPNYSCYSYPVLGQVKCDNRTHKCVIIEV